MMTRRKTASLLTAVAHAWRALGDPSPGLVVALSGGPDSVALTRALLTVRGESRTPLVLAHLDHQIRGAASAVDAEFVRALHAKLNDPTVALACDRLDVAALARGEKENLEAVARRERYRWLAEVARVHGLRYVATGHTANDQAETVLHRLIRGTGIDGMRGIAARRELEPGIVLVRPLLEVSRSAVEAYLTELNQPACRDETNADLRYTRNRLRHDLLPLLEREYNPRVVEALIQIARQAGELSEELERQAGELLHQAERPRAGRMVVLDVERLRQAPRWQARAAFVQLWHRENWPRGAMGHEEFERLVDLIHAERGASDLPGHVRVRRTDHVLQLERLRS